jgi:hypothetical protein
VTTNDDGPKGDIARLELTVQATTFAGQQRRY